MNSRQVVSKTKLRLAMLLTALTVLALSNVPTAEAASRAPTNEKKLKIVFLMGQSNMVGYSNPMTAWYLTQPMYVPPPKMALAKSRYYDEGFFYWQGVSFAYGSDQFNAEGKALLQERKASRAHWRALVYGNFGRNATRNDWRPEYGPAPKTGTKTMYPFLDKKAARGEPSPMFTLIGIGILAYIFVMTWLGYTANPMG